MKKTHSEKQPKKFALAGAFCAMAAVFACSGSGDTSIDLDAAVSQDSGPEPFDISGGFDATVDGMTSGKCVPRTCASAGVNCGPIGDGCGGLIADCGSCKAPEICGGGGVPSVCGNSFASEGGPPCTPLTCATAGANCGPIADGCGGLVKDCGTCVAPETCGGAGKPSVCGILWSGDGAPMDAPLSCTPTTCAALGYNCGPAGDGCGGLLSCGTCTAPDICGGGGKPSVCGNGYKTEAGLACAPTTCAALGFNCGPAGDGCGGMLSCGTCTAPDICGGGGTPSVCGGGGGDGGVPCTGLCLKIPTCSSGTTTSLSGTVYAPGHAPWPSGVSVYGTPDPLYGAIVYIPNAPVAPFATGVSCDKCGASVSGSPLVSTITGPDGKFTLKNVPAGASIPLVIQLGRWRRQVTISTVSPCVDNPVGADLTRLPRNKTEGDIPLTAISTGNVDALECVLRKMGVDDGEFTTPSGTGRIHLYTDNGSNAGSGTPAASTLYSSLAELSKHDMVLFSCVGSQQDKLATYQKNVIDYSNAGGRIFTTHFSYVWLYNDAPFSGTATWKVNQAQPTNPLLTTVDITFPKGKAFSTWLDVVGASTAPGSNQVNVNVPRHDFDAVITPSQRWLYWGTAPTPIHYTFNTPVGALPASQCGRVVFSDFHVADSSTSGTTFPAECSASPMTAQEKVLEFMLFDLASCITPDDTPPPPPPTCKPTTCAALGIKCGPAGDGCGGLLACGTCVAPDTCGGGGKLGECGSPKCTPISCTTLGIKCGPAGDGCGGLLACGPCVPPDTCGGGGKLGECGSPKCTPITCATLGIKCGPSGDGCGGMLDCGKCVAPDTCGGGGKTGECGHSDALTCSPLTCLGLGIKCGPAADGCGGLLDCGKCIAPDTCGGGGKAGECGSPKCTPTTCAALGIECGPAGDGCGGLLGCGTCTPPQTCGGGGIPGKCGGGTK